MSPRRALAALPAFAAAALLAACGGGATGTGPTTSGGVETTGPTIGTYTAFSDPTSLETSALIYIATDNTGSASTGSAGNLDHDANVILGGLLAGTLNGARTEIDLGSGVTAVITNPDNTEYTRIFVTEGLPTDLFGVLGQATIGADLPVANDSLHYDGTAQFAIADGDALYDLTANLRVTPDWEAGRVDSAFTSLSGTRNDGSITNVSNLGTLRIDDATLSGGTFAGGTASITGATFDLSGSESLAGTEGTFMGPLADEVGGIVLIDDTASGNLQVIGVYTAE